MLASPVPDPRPRPAGPSSCHFRLACLRSERHGGNCWHGRPEWELLFGWPVPDSADNRAGVPPAALLAIDIDGLLPAQLQWVQVCNGRDPLYTVDSCQCAGGHVASAGELLHAMASYGGTPGLRITAADLGGKRLLQGLRMSLRVLVDGVEADALARIRVDARLC